MRRLKSPNREPMNALESTVVPIGSAARKPPATA
jgi:hypothetical protein